jgi:hypothetical protein
MCKQCIQRWDKTGNQMSNFLQEQFHAAVMRDMMTTDEEGMFYLFCYEQAWCGFDDAMMPVMFGEMMAEITNLMG